MAALYLATGEQRAGRWLYLVAVAGIAFLLLTGSRTALVAMLVSLAASWFVLAPPKKKLVFAAAVILVAAVGLIAAALVTSGDAGDLIALGRTDSDTSSFTGRVPLWTDLLKVYMPQRYLAGYGYGAFWTEERILEVSRVQAWSVAHAHSTYIDFVLNTGYIGAALCMSAMALALVTALKVESRHPRAGYGFTAMIVIFALVGGLVETYIGTTWLLSFFGITSICLLVYRDDKSTTKPRLASEVPRAVREPSVHCAH
jgi:exopolysaccharide production protein ExoQ